jgi:hypothetical protein
VLAEQHAFWHYQGHTAQDTLLVLRPPPITQRAGTSPMAPRNLVLRRALLPALLLALGLATEPSGVMARPTGAPAERPAATAPGASSSVAACAQAQTPSVVDVVLTWRQLERAAGAIDLRPLEGALATAYARQQRVCLRLAAIDLTQACATPDDLVAHSTGGFTVASGTPHAPFRAYVPDINDPYVLGRMQTLVRSVARSYDGDPRLAWVVISLVGDGGRWDEHTLTYPQRSNLLAHPDPEAPLARRATLASQQAVVDSFVQAFTSTPLLMPLSLPQGARYALSRSKTVGALAATPEQAKTVPSTRWRTAAVVGLTSNGWTPAQVHNAHLAAILESPRADRAHKNPAPDPSGDAAKAVAGCRLALHRVTVAPVLQADGLYRIDGLWSNLGSAPAYDPLYITWSLRRSAGSPAVWESPSRLRGDTLAPGQAPRRVRDSGRLPQGLKPGRYQLCVTVQDNAYWQPLLPVTAVAEVSIAERQPLHLSR